MRWDGSIIDISELKRTINVLKPNRQLFEVRIFGADKRKVISGYFTDADTMISKLDTVDIRDKNIYITLNKVNAALYSRTQKDRFVAYVNTTSDTEIDRYEWLFIDLDPKRPADVSSSNSELAEAEKLKEKVKSWLKDRGFSEPIEALSGNGYHLLYRIDLPGDDESKQLMSDCLNVIASLFNNSTVKIDTVNYNQARICKLYGTLAQKGADDESRPHRMSRIIAVPGKITVNSKQLLLALSAELPKPSPRMQPKYNSAKPEFDLRSWLSSHGMTYKETDGIDCKILSLDECPFDASHKNGDSKIFAYSNGAIAFKCHHNSCHGRTWQDVRLKYEPEAYDYKQNDQRVEEGYKQHKRNKKEVEEVIPLKGDPKPEPQKPKEKKIFRKLKTAEALMAKELPDLRAIVGVDNELPILVEGTCILSAKPKLGKSWFALAMCLAVANGEDFLGYKTEKCSALYLDLETSEVIQKKRLKKALKDRDIPKNFYLETETDSLNDGFIDQIEAYLQEDPNIGIVVIDVFQIIRSPAKNMKESDYEHAYRDITPLNELAQKHHIAIILVCHDRKAVDPDDPFSNILGSTGLQGAATQMIVMFRKRKDDPIHISVKGKTIDGLPELNVKLEDAEWKIAQAVNTADRDREEALAEYMESTIRKAVIALTEHNKVWKGRCSALVQDAIDYEIAVTDSPKTIGGFLHRHQARFLAQDHIKVTILENGTGPKIYKIEKSTIDTIDEIENLPLMEPEEASVYAGSEDYYL